MSRRHPLVLLALAVVWSVLAASVASGQQARERQAERRSSSPLDTNEHLLDPQHHGPAVGHLPPDERNVELVSRLKLTNLEGGIADVGYYEGYAYLNAWYPECAATGAGGVHVVDVRDPKNPKKVGFLPAEANNTPGEGIHVFTASTPSFQGDLLLTNNEQCDDTVPAKLGMSIWDVTNPLAPKKITQFGDATPVVGNTTYHSIHSVQGWSKSGKAFAVMVDNIEFPDVDIVDITNPAAPIMASETDIFDWPDAQSPLAHGESPLLHDMQFKRIGGHDFLALSYWDAGQILLNVDDPYNPKFVGDSDYKDPDPETGHSPPEGNSHESYWSSNNQFLISTDEDFDTFRTTPLKRVTGNPSFPAPEEYTTVGVGGAPVDILPDKKLNGPVAYGGYGCPGTSTPIPAADTVVPPGSLAPGEEQIIVLQRGPSGDPNNPEPACFPGEKADNATDQGWDAVILTGRHLGSAAADDPPNCGFGAFPADEEIVAVCTTHTAMHELFARTPDYTNPYPPGDPGDVEPNIGEVGFDVEITAVFDGWGYVQLHDATKPNLPIIDTYAIPEALDVRYAQDFGDLTVHEVKTDPRPNVNLAYFSYYSAGFRVAQFGPSGISEVGRYIAKEGNDFWGVFPIGDEYAGHGYPNPADQPYTAPLVLASDRSYGLYIFRYTGSAGTCRGQEITALGTQGNDAITGTSGNDVISALGGNDVVDGIRGDDILCGDAGNDLLKGGSGKDKEDGGVGNDNLKGAKGRDFLNEGPDKGRCNGGPGRDKGAGCEKKKSIP